MGDHLDRRRSGQGGSHGSRASRSIGELAREPPTAAETEAARNHLLGRDLTAAQSNEELTAKLAREFIETGGLRSHDQLRLMLQTITPRDLAAAANAFVNGTVIRVDVAH